MKKRIISWVVCFVCLVLLINLAYFKTQTFAQDPPRLEAGSVVSSIQPQDPKKIDTLYSGLLTKLLPQRLYSFYNLINNASFEIWQQDPNPLPASWLFETDTGLISKDAQFPKLDSSSVLIDTSTSIPGQATKLYQVLPNPDYYYNKELIFGCWVKTDSQEVTLTFKMAKLYSLQTLKAYLHILAQETGNSLF